MLPPTIALLFALTPGGDASASRHIAAPCRLVEERAIQYFDSHDFFAARKHVLGKPVDDLVVVLTNRKKASTPSAERLSLNRFSIRKYTLPRRLSPLKAYRGFDLDGELKLAEATDGSCMATLRFEISAYEWVWMPVVMDDGYRSKFISNGTLERLYMDAVGDLFAKTK